LFSSLKKTGVEQVEEVVEAWFDAVLKEQDSLPDSE
jgi:GTP-binding protein